MKDKTKLKILFPKPPVYFSKSGAPFTRVKDIFHSEEGQKLISRMATMRDEERKKAG